MTNKRCSKCQYMKNEDDFGNDKHSFDGKRTYCKQCANEQTRKYKKKHPEKVKWAKKKSVYGIGKRGYDAMIKFQDNKCPICQCDLDTVTPCIDHNHALEKSDPKYVRGICCTSCNVGLGHFKDSLSVLRRAADYLEMKGGQE